MSDTTFVPLKETTDMMGVPLGIGDLVAYPTSSGSSPRMCVGTIEDIIIYEHKWHNYSKKTTTVTECWKAKIRPVAHTDYRATDHWSYKDGKYTPTPLKNGPRAVTINRVENLVRVQLPSTPE